MATREASTRPRAGGLVAALGAAARPVRLGGPRHQAHGLVVDECGGLPGRGVRVLRVLAGDPGDHGTDERRRGRVWVAGGTVRRADGGRAQPHGGDLRGAGAGGQVGGDRGGWGRARREAAGVGPGGKARPLHGVGAAGVGGTGVGRGRGNAREVARSKAGWCGRDAGSAWSGLGYSDP